MIYGMRTDEVRIYELLHGFDCCFYLTGSRRYGNFSPTSDWDFFVQGRPTLGVWLLKYGFTPCDNTIYMNQDTINSRNIVGIWVHRKLPVHVIVCCDLSLALAAQNVVIGLRLLDHIDKRTAWERAYNFVAGRR